MSLGKPRPGNPLSHPGEPGVGVDLAPPFAPHDESTRWLFGLNRFGIRPGLGRIRGLLADLGHPENKLETLVVAGTNGKGSATRILAHLLQGAGCRVVTFTSPHLLKVHERIRINDRPIAADDFARRVDAIRPSTERHEASWFETLTALAVQVAVDEKADFFCCETGLGGRLDATNALPSKALLLTTVGLDHERILGGTREEIATEKLGLLKPGVPLFCGVDDRLRPLVFQQAVTVGSPVYFLDELARWPRETFPDGPQPWDLALREHYFENLPDPGTASMRRNLALALLALTELEPRLDRSLLPADVSSALGNLFLPGRYQHLLLKPDFIFDTAHNGQALAGSLAQFVKDESAGRRVVFFGSMHNKELEDLPRELWAEVDLILGAPVSIPRSRTDAELTRLFQHWGIDASGRKVVPDLATGLAWLAANLRPEDRVLVTGSCFMVAEVLYILGFTDLDKTRQPVPAEPVLVRLDQAT